MTIHPGLHRDRVDQEDVDFFMSVLDNRLGAKSTLFETFEEYSTKMKTFKVFIAVTKRL